MRRRLSFTAPRTLVSSCCLFTLQPHALIMSFRISIFFSLACAASAWAGHVSLSVEGAADYALKHNPTLTAARLRIEEARGRLQQSGRLTNPELELDFARNVRGQEGSASIA